MKKILIIIFIAGLILSIAELMYVSTSPLLGEGDINQMIYKNKIGLNKHLNNTNQMYQNLYTHRVHKADPYAGVYKLVLVGSAVTDTMTFGTKLWEMGIFRGCKSSSTNSSYSSKELQDFWISKYKHRSTGLTSQFIPLEKYFTSSFNKPAYKGLYLMPLGWSMLNDLGYGNSIFLFEEKCGGYNNISGRLFLEGLAYDYSVYLARMSFTDSVLKGESKQGILYMAYYPYYNKTWIFIYNIPKENVLKSKVDIDGIEHKKEVIYPFILVDGYLPLGNHKILVTTSQEDYELNLTVLPQELMIAEAMLRSNGEQTIILANLINDTIYLNSVESVLENNEKKVAILNQIMTPYNSTMVELNFTKNINPDNFYNFNITILYSINSKEYLLNREIVLLGE